MSSAGWLILILLVVFTLSGAGVLMVARQFIGPGSTAPLGTEGSLIPPGTPDPPPPTTPKAILRHALRSVGTGCCALGEQGKGWLIQFELDSMISSNAVTTRDRSIDTFIQILKAVKDSGLVYDAVTIEATYVPLDKFGNATPRTVALSMTFRKATVARINWQREARLHDTIYAVADEFYIRPTSR
jgi:hypothetical protein